MTRRFLIFFVILFGAFCVAPCQAEDATSAATMRVGLAKVDITPPLGYPMSGYYYERGATGVLDPLFAKAAVFDDGQRKVALVVCDLIGISTDLCRLVRERAANATDIPAENIMVSATHCHTGPDYYADLRRHVRKEDAGSGPREKYPEHLIAGVAAAIENADGQLAEMTLAFGKGHEESVAFNRRFVMSDGSIRTWANYQDPSVVRAAGPIDPAIDFLLFQDSAQEQTFGCLNVFALHLDTTGGTQFSADFPFHLEKTLQERFGPEFISIFAAGTCGDINHVNPRSKDRNRPHVIGGRLGDALLNEVDSLTVVTPAIRASSRQVAVPMKTFREEEYQWALDLISRDKAKEKLPFLDEVKAYNTRLLGLLREGRSGNNDGGQGWGASESLVGIGDALPVEIQILQLGQETAIVGLPGEVFVDLGLAIKRASPYHHTMVIELTNSDESGYIPTRVAYQGGGYEVLNSVFQAGSGEMLVDAAIEMLRETKELNDQ